MGISLGVIFIIYEPLKPQIYSIGGLFLAIGTMLLAKLYSKILNIGWFYKITLFTEILMLFVVLLVLLHPYGYQMALFVYIGYQIMFIFASYLIRGETLFLYDIKLLSRLDIYKQIGYIGGMGISYLFYEAMQTQSHFDQVYKLHYILLVLQLFVILFVYRSFKKT